MENPFLSSCTKLLAGLHSLLAVKQKPLISSHLSLCTGCLIVKTWQLASPRMSNPKERKRKVCTQTSQRTTKMETTVFYNLICQVAYHHTSAVCHSLYSWALVHYWRRLLKGIPGGGDHWEPSWRLAITVCPLPAAPLPRIPASCFSYSCVLPSPTLYQVWSV